MDLLKDRRCTTRRNRCFKRPVRKKHGRHPTIISRSYADEEYRKSLWAIRIGEQQTMLFDRIALEKHYTSTKADRIQNTKHLDSPFERRWTSATSQSATGTRQSNKRVQTTARRAPGKDPAKLQTHPSQPTSSTKKRTTVRRRWRLRLCGWPKNRMEILQRVAVKPADSFVIVIALGSNPLAEGMMLRFAESGHPEFRVSSALERVEFKSKGKGVKTIHFNGGDETVELVLRTVISVNQLSVHGGVADLCKELARDSAGAGKPINGDTERISNC